MHELQAAIETAQGSRDPRAEAEQRIETAERSDAREVAKRAAGAEPSEDERFELIAAGWEEFQLDEYAKHGPELRRVLLALYDGSLEGARPVLEQLVRDADEPRYLWFELGRVRLLDGDTEGGREALATLRRCARPGRRRRGALDGAHGAGDAGARSRATSTPRSPSTRPRSKPCRRTRDRTSAMAALLSARRLGGRRGRGAQLARSASLEQDGQRQWRLSLELGLAHAALDGQARSDRGARRRGQLPGRAARARLAAGLRGAVGRAARKGRQPRARARPVQPARGRQRRPQSLRLPPPRGAL